MRVRPSRCASSTPLPLGSVRAVATATLSLIQLNCTAAAGIVLSFPSRATATTVSGRLTREIGVRVNCTRFASCWTVTVAVSARPLLEATTRVWPLRRAVTRPVVSTAATFESLEDQVSRAAGTEFPRTSRASAEIVVISPMLRNRAFWGVSCTEETVWRTVTVARARAVSTRASIVAGRPLLRAR